MKVGDLVTAIKSCQAWHGKGIVVSVEGRKWIKVAWVDGIIEREHIDDLELIYENR